MLSLQDINAVTEGMKVTDKRLGIDERSRIIPGRQGFGYCTRI